MIVDSSALIAILRDEAESPAFSRAIESARHARVGAPTLLEASIVARSPLLAALDEIVSEIEVVPFDRAQALAARDAYARFGKGSGSPARLNFGDCMAYALAQVTGEPLLFKGDDFTRTDVTPAIPQVGRER